MRRTMGVLALAALCSCEFVRPPTALENLPPTISVHAMLIAGADSAHVMVTRTPPDVPPGSIASSEPVTEASVWLSSGDDEIQLHGGAMCVAPNGFVPEPAGLEAGCYAARVPGGVRFGARYELTVDAPGMEPIRGIAETPSGSPLITAPAPGTTIIADATGFTGPLATGTDVHWSAPAAETPYLLLAVDASDCEMYLSDIERLFAPAIGVSDRHAVTVSFFGICNTSDPGVVPGSLALLAYGEDYLDFRRGLNDERVDAARASFGLSGAYGTFVGAAMNSIPVQFDIRTPRSPF